MALARKIIAVTDGCKGMGLRIVRGLIHAAQEPLLIYVTGPSNMTKDQRSRAVSFQDDLKTANAVTESGSEIRPMEMDLESKKSVQDFRDHLRAKHGGKSLSVLINSPAPRFSDAKRSVDRTFFGTKFLTRALLSQFKEDGKSRIVNLTTYGGHPQIYQNPIIAEKFLLENLDLMKLSDLMQKYQRDAANGRQVSEGWSELATTRRADWTPYIVPMMGIAAQAMLMAKYTEGILINASGGDHWTDNHTTQLKNALTPTFLALGDLEGVTGKFWYGGKQTEW